jgi:hypothetical protein
MPMKKQSSQAIAAINDLIIPVMENLKLKTIANKIYHSVNLTQEEKFFGIHSQTVKNLTF